MSVWNAVSAGFQIVQEKLDQALGDESNVQESTDDHTPPSEASHVTPVDQSDRLQSSSEDSAVSLQQALKDAEQQNQLLNLEYARLLREKEEELTKLREQVQLPSDVVELQQSLRERDNQLKEFNTKAEAKFNKLKSQAKTKIASLTEELEKVKGELSISQESLNVSITSAAATDESDSVIEQLKQELSLKTQECDLLLQQFEETESKWKQQLQEERDTNQQLLTETESRYQLENSELSEKISSLQQEVAHCKEEVNSAVSSRDQAVQLIEREREEKGKLTQQVAELINKLEDSEKRMTRDFSFASSEFQIVSSQISQTDSEEEWKVIRGSGSSSEGKESSPPPEIVSLPLSEDSPGPKGTKSSDKGVPLRATPELLKSRDLSLENQLAEKEKELQSLREQLEKLSEDLNTSNATLQSYEEKTTEPAVALSHLTEENERLSSQLTSMHEVVSEMEEELAGKSHDLDELRGRVVLLDEALSKREEELLAKEQEMVTFKEKRDGEMKRLQEENDDQKRKYEQEREKNVAINEDMSQIQNVLKEKEDEIEKLLIEGEKRNEEIAELCQQLKLAEINKEREVELVRETSLQELTAVTEDHARKLTEKVEELNQLKAENKASQIESLEHSLQEKEKEIAELRDSTSKEVERLTQELNYALSEIKVFEETRTREKCEREQLRGEVNRLTESNSTFSADSAKCRENIMALEEQLNTVQRERDKLSERLETKLKSEKALKKELDENKRRNHEMTSELDRYRSETGRMNEQFESALNILKQENQQLKSELTECTNDRRQLNKMSESLREQITAEGERSVALKEEKKQLKEEVKTINNRCANLEGERDSLLQKITELTAIQNQLQMSLETVSKEKESLAYEQDTTLRNSQSLETRVLELTNQIVTLVREKETADSSIRQLQRTLATHEREKEDMTLRIQSLESQGLLQKGWSQERESLVARVTQMQLELTNSLQEREKLENEKVHLEGTVTSLEKNCESLESALKISQEEGLKGQNEAKRITELETMLSELRQSHVTELTKLQVLLDAERTAKLQALEQSQKQSTDYVINMDDSPIHTDGNTLNVAGQWLQRFVKNPNIVLMRLVRATPQTKLLFFGYFILVHILLLYLWLAY